MRVIVVGAGVVGVCTAWYLRRHGMDVAVVERRSGVAQEASHGNAGIVSAGLARPWAAPGMPGRLLASLFRADSPALFRPGASPALWSWFARWVGECRLERHRVNRERMQRVALLSRERLRALRADVELQYERTDGCLLLLRSARELDHAAPARALLEEAGVACRELAPDACRALEPGLSERTALAGGLLLPDDESGNCAQFAQALRRRAEDEGVRFRFNQPVTRLLVDAGRVGGVLVGDRPAQADAVVVASGLDSAGLLRSAGLRVPIHPVKGCSLTVALDPSAIGPRRAIVDEAWNTAIVPLGGRLRVAGTAELGDRQLRRRAAVLRTLTRVANDWFPGAARYSTAQYWAGVRPMLPDGPPLLGPTPIPGLFVNVGHGAAGWTMAAGAGSVVADVVAGRAPPIPLDGLTIDRYR